jgi:aminodeoxyfutalosine deaminase
MDLVEFARQIPKAELHVHLEGSIQPGTLMELARRNRVALPVSDEAGLREVYRFKDFAHFVETYMAVTGCLRTPDDYQLIAYQFGADRARQNIRYTEATFSILTNVQFTGLPWQEILKGLNTGRERARRDFDVEIQWVFDIVRDNPETQSRVLEIALAAQDEGCVALGLGGNEAKFPPELFAETFAKAHQAGLPRVPHSGETGGPANIWTSIDQLYADRLGHGVHCIEDPGLVAELRKRQIPLEVCPTSNVRLKVFPDYPSHPLRRLWDAGLAITIGSDDPPMFNTDLNQEYEILVEYFHFTVEELERASLNGLNFSLLPEGEKARLEAEFRGEFARLREVLK